MNPLISRLRTSPRRLMAARLVVGLAAASACVLVGPQLDTLIAHREGFAPVGMAVLLVGLLHPRFRHWFIIALCFSVSLLAVRDGLRSADLPPALDSAFLHAIYPAVWLSVALLSAAAGLLEAVRPGGLGARRCYFAAAGTYLAGHGYTNFLWEPTWQKLVMLTVGVAALLAAVFAQREFAEEPPVGLSEEESTELDRRRRQAVALREWREVTDYSGKRS